MIFHRFTLGEMVANCYVAADENTKNAVLFDAPTNPEKILGYLDENGLTLKYILLTHAHFDHIMAVDGIKKATGAKLVLHRDEVKYLNDGVLNLAVTVPVEIPKLKEDIVVSDGDEIVMDSFDIKVIHTPGHTEGSACYLMGDILISGDTLFNRSVGRADFPLGNFENEIKSIKEKLMPLDDGIKVFPGHGFSTDIGHERKENPYLI